MIGVMGKVRGRMGEEGGGVMSFVTVTCPSTFGLDVLLFRYIPMRVQLE